MAEPTPNRPPPDVGQMFPGEALPAVPEAVRRERFRDVDERIRARADDAFAGPLALWRERHHPLVRAFMKSSRRRRIGLTIFCVSVPLAVLVAATLMKASPRGSDLPYFADELLLLMTGFWPLFCVLLAGIDAAAGVLNERDRDTALQIVLTPLPKRAIAAAKVLPVVWPPLWGIVALLPLCLLTGSLGAGVAWAMGLATTWAAAHWGAAYAVRTMSFPKAVLFLAGRLALTAVAIVMMLFAAVLCAAFVGCSVGLLLASIDEILAVIAVVGVMLATFLYLCYGYFLVSPVRMVLLEFTWFDWLAFDDADSRPRRGPLRLPGIGDRV